MAFMSRSLYAPITPYHREWLAVDSIHQLYIEQSGNPEGIAVIYLHDGPGMGSCDEARRFFDPEVYRIIVIDQRGCGRSIPAPCLIDNTTDFLLADLDKIRQHLGVCKWVLFGSNWGATLALLYTIKYKACVAGLILNGVFLATKEELNWRYGKEGLAKLFADYFDELVKGAKQNEGVGSHDTVINIYQQCFSGQNELAVLLACKAWYCWHRRIETLETLTHEECHAITAQQTHQALCFAQVANHYFAKHCFLPEDYITENIEECSAIPATIIQGRYDLICRLSSAEKFMPLWSRARLQIVPKTGHCMLEAEKINAICHATDAMASFLNQADLI